MKKRRKKLIHALTCNPGTGKTIQLTRPPAEGPSDQGEKTFPRKTINYDILLDFLHCARPDLDPGSGKKDAPLRQWSKEIGISHPCLCKLLQRKPIKLETFLIICSYLEMSTDTFIKDSNE